ncbi:MAG TPA: zf-TFIIB domain-containing protein [Longimicrobiales bacterium]|nr:zf-TFIIB domain-containing protein [Longimicrobiales bacterium]
MDRKWNRCARCGKEWTGKQVEGVPTCDSCRASLQGRREEPRNCPVDGARMAKDVVLYIAVDRCPECHGVWLDGGELDLIKKASHEEGFSTGLAAGLAVL